MMRESWEIKGGRWMGHAEQNWGLIANIKTCIK
jgi:hypothetical protein